MPATKRARKIRQASEFNASRLAATLRTPATTTAAYSWTVTRIASARDAQIRGQFAEPARMAKAMRTDDALFVPWSNRIAPQRCLAVELVPSKGARGGSVSGEAEALYGERGVGIAPGSLSGIVGDYINHRVAFGYVEWAPRDDGSRVDLILHHWPIEHVRWDSVARLFVARVESVPDAERKAASELGVSSSSEVPIVHGDGRWIVFSDQENEPFAADACLLPGALIWAAHAFASSDWAKGSASHGNAKVVGELPENVSIGSSDSLTDEAMAFAELLKGIAADDAPYGIRPFGSKIDYLVNSSGAWQVWERLMVNREKAAARVYLGSDAILGSIGGAPGVDIVALFRIASTILQGDIGVLERCISTGLLEPWAAINFGDSSLAPTRRYLLPDPDADAEREAFAKRQQAFFADLKAAKDSGCVVDQVYVDEIAKRYAVPAISVATAVAPSPLPGAAQSSTPTAAPAPEPPAAA
jgi:hypothetical protein